jgi:hypothetical protein
MPDWAADAGARGRVFRSYAALWGSAYRFTPSRGSAATWGEVEDKVEVEVEDKVEDEVELRGAGWRTILSYLLDV